MIANGITVGRLLLSLLLLGVPACTPAFYVLYGLCGLTDMIDGPVARRMGTVSRRGARLDSIADLVFCGVCFYRLFPVLRFPLWLWAWVALVFMGRVGNVGWGYRRFGRLVLLHTPLNRLTGALLFLFPFAMGVTDGTAAAILLCAAASVATAEEAYRIRTGKGLDAV